MPRTRFFRPVLIAMNLSVLLAGLPAWSKRQTRLTLVILATRSQLGPDDTYALVQVLTDPRPNLKLLTTNFYNAEERARLMVE